MRYVKAIAYFCLVVLLVVAPIAMLASFDITLGYRKMVVDGCGCPDCRPWVVGPYFIPWSIRSVLSDVAFAAYGLLFVIGMCSASIALMRQFDASRKPSPPGTFSRCGYDLSGLGDSDCPECGTEHGIKRQKDR